MLVCVFLPIKNALGGGGEGRYTRAASLVRPQCGRLIGHSSIVALFLSH